MYPARQATKTRSNKLLALLLQYRCGQYIFVIIINFDPIKPSFDIDFFLPVVKLSSVVLCLLSCLVYIYVSFKVLVCIVVS
jgi:hypothetical protein